MVGAANGESGVRVRGGEETRPNKKSKKDVDAEHDLRWARVSNPLGVDKTLGSTLTKFNRRADHSKFTRMVFRTTSTLQKPFTLERTREGGKKRNKVDVYPTVCLLCVERGVSKGDVASVADAALHDCLVGSSLWIGHKFIKKYNPTNVYDHFIIRHSDVSWVAEEIKKRTNKQADDILVTGVSKYDPKPRRTQPSVLRGHVSKRRVKQFHDHLDRLFVNLVISNGLPLRCARWPQLVTLLSSASLGPAPSPQAVKAYVPPDRRKVRKIAMGMKEVLDRDVKADLERCRDASRGLPFIAACHDSVTLGTGAYFGVALAYITPEWDYKIRMWAFVKKELNEGTAAAQALKVNTLLSDRVGTWALDKVNSVTADTTPSSRNVWEGVAAGEGVQGSGLDGGGGDAESHMSDSDDDSSGWGSDSDDGEGEGGGKGEDDMGEALGLVDEHDCCMHSMSLPLKHGLGMVHDDGTTFDAFPEGEAVVELVRDTCNFFSRGQRTLEFRAAAERGGHDFVTFKTGGSTRMAGPHSAFEAVVKNGQALLDLQKKVMGGGTNKLTDFEKAVKKATKKGKLVTKDDMETVQEYEAIMHRTASFIYIVQTESRPVASYIWPLVEQLKEDLYPGGSSAGKLHLRELKNPKGARVERRILERNMSATGWKAAVRLRTTLDHYFSEMDVSEMETVVANPGTKSFFFIRNKGNREAWRAEGEERLLKAVQKVASEGGGGDSGIVPSASPPDDGSPSPPPQGVDPAAWAAHLARTGGMGAGGSGSGTRDAAKAEVGRYLAHHETSWGKYAVASGGGVGVGTAETLTMEWQVRNVDILAWWKAHAEIYPNVAIVARCWLSLPPAQSIVERGNSHGKLVSPPDRCLQKGDIFEALVLGKINAKRVGELLAHGKSGVEGK